MKKIFLVAIATVGFAFSGTAQDTKMKVGVDFGIPMGDIKDGTSFNLGVNAAYTWNVGEGFDAGAGVSYNTYFAKEVDMGPLGKVKGDNANFLPIYGTANYGFTENIFVGADLGYAIGLTDGIDGGFYYQPKVGYQTEMFEVFLGYKGLATSTEVDTPIGKISSDTVFSSINLGFNYKF